MKRNERIRTMIICLTLAFGTLALYWPARTFDFVNYDDLDYVVNNFHVNRGFHWADLAWCFGAGYACNWHPLTWISHTLDCQLYGLRAGGHHLTNVLLHAANSAMLFLVLKRLTGAFWRSAMVAALFAWHPLHVESVAWVSERKDVLCAFFWILTMWAYACYAEFKVQSSSAKLVENKVSNPRLYYILAVGFFALALMSKPMAVTLPFVLLLLDGWPLNRFSMGFRKLLTEKIPFFVLSVASCCLTVYAQKTGGAVQSFEDESINSRVSNVLLAWWDYVEKTVAPKGLAAMYPLDRHIPAWEALLAGLFLACVCCVVFLLRKKQPWLLVGWLWYLGTLVPVIGLVQVGAQGIADRYTYLPSIGLFIMGCWGLYEMTRKWRYHEAALALASVAALGVYAALTSSQLQYWQNSGELFKHAIKVTKNNFVAHATYGSYLLNSGHLKEAQAECEEAVRIDSNYASAHMFLGNLFLQEGKLDDSAKHLVIALQLIPTLPGAHYFLGQVLLQKNLPAQAVEQFEAALKGDPASPAIHRWLGKSLATEGHLDEACAQYYEALRLVENYPDAHYELALALSMQNKTGEAITHYRAALRLRPADPQALNNLAWILAANGHAEFRNGQEAVELARKACALTRDAEPMFIGTLAAAYAEAGEFDDAVAAAQKAHDVAAAQGLEKLAARNLELLEIYRSHHAYHES